MKTNLLFFFVILFVFSIQTKRSATIGLQPFKGFNKNLIDTVSKTVKQVYGFDVVILPEKELPKSAFVNIKSPRYRADSLLLFLKRSKPAHVDYVIGLTQKDISTTKHDSNGNIKKPEYKYTDWGVFGLGYCPGPCCIVSTFRLKKTTPENFILRLKKISIHELGHNLGLHHCPTPQCVLNDANETIKTIDRAKLKLCNNCINKIK